jgi:hypothetical protein
MFTHATKLNKNLNKCANYKSTSMAMGVQISKESVFILFSLG